jgi:hypothetical protein
MLSAPCACPPARAPRLTLAMCSVAAHKARSFRASFEARVMAPNVGHCPPRAKLAASHGEFPTSRESFVMSKVVCTGAAVIASRRCCMTSFTSGVGVPLTRYRSDVWSYSHARTARRLGALAPLPMRRGRPHSLGPTTRLKGSGTARVGPLVFFCSWRGLNCAKAQQATTSIALQEGELALP